MAARPGEKTSFALACGLLSQYMKEKGNNNLNLNRGKSEAYQRPTTMRLLPGAEVETEIEMEENGNAFDSVSSINEMELFPQSAGFEASNPEEKNLAKEEKKSQLTIVYGGRVLVFDDFPAEKVEDLMNFARKGNSTSCNSTYTPSSSSSSTQISVSDQSNVVASTTTTVPKQTQAGFSDLPIMRKASLQRFLEKRKDRLNAKAPYQQACANKKESFASKKEEDIEELWLGLGPKV